MPADTAVVQAAKDSVSRPSFLSDLKFIDDICLLAAVGRYGFFHGEEKLGRSLFVIKMERLFLVEDILT